MITAKRLREVLYYDPTTGIFRWIALTHPSAHRIKLGAVAGHANSFGHLQITIDGKFYMAHRLAWLYVTGFWPKNNLDHKDRVPSNNRWKNLREATPTQNVANSKKRADSRTRLKGVSITRDGKYVARIRVSGVQTYLGLFISEQSAHRAYLKAARQHFGEFAHAG